MVNRYHRIAMTILLFIVAWHTADASGRSACLCGGSRCQNCKRQLSDELSRLSVSQRCDCRPCVSTFRAFGHTHSDTCACANQCDRRRSGSPLRPEIRSYTVTVVIASLSVPRVCFRLKVGGTDTIEAIADKCIEHLKLDHRYIRYRRDHQTGIIAGDRDLLSQLAVMDHAAIMGQTAVKRYRLDDVPDDQYMTDRYWLRVSAEEQVHFRFTISGASTVVPSAKVSIDAATVAHRMVLSAISQLPKDLFDPSTDYIEVISGLLIQCPTKRDESVTLPLDEPIYEAFEERAANFLTFKATIKIYGGRLKAVVKLATLDKPQKPYQCKCVITVSMTLEDVLRICETILPASQSSRHWTAVFASPAGKLIANEAEWKKIPYVRMSYSQLTFQESEALPGYESIRRPPSYTENLPSSSGMTPAASRHTSVTTASHLAHPSHIVRPQSAAAGFPSAVAQPPSFTRRPGQTGCIPIYVNVKPKGGRGEAIRRPCAIQINDQQSVAELQRLSAAHLKMSLKFEPTAKRYQNEFFLKYTYDEDDKGLASELAKHSNQFLLFEAQRIHDDNSEEDVGRAVPAAQQPSRLGSDSGGGRHKRHSSLFSGFGGNADYSINTVAGTSAAAAAGITTLPTHRQKSSRTNSVLQTFLPKRDDKHN